VTYSVNVSAYLTADAKRFGRSAKSSRSSLGRTRAFLKEALKAQKLEGYWTAYDADGRPKV
jgi:hypothetical protein